MSDFFDDDFEDIFGDPKPPARKDELTFKEKLYINELITTGCKQLACERAGFASPPNRALVRYELKKLRDYYAYSVEDQTKKVVNEFAKIAFFDPREVFNEDGTPKNIIDLDEETAACISGVDIQTLGKDKDFAQVTKVRFNDKMKALDALAKRLGMYKADNEHNVNLGGEIAVKDVSDNEKLRRVAFMLVNAAMSKKNSEKSET